MDPWTPVSTSSTTSRTTRSSRSSPPPTAGEWAAAARTAMEHPETTTRELTLEEAVTLAIQLQRDGQLPAAEALYRRVFDVAPDHPRALHYAGVLAHQRGRTEDAVALVSRSLALRPDEADWHSNLGIILQADG